MARSSKLVAQSSKLNFQMPDTKTFDLSDKELNIGDVFTPLRWGEFAIQQFGIFQKWLEGATIFDPTMGEGNLLESLITYGISAGMSMPPRMKGRWETRG